MYVIISCGDNKAGNSSGQGLVEYSRETPALFLDTTIRFNVDSMDSMVSTASLPGGVYILKEGAVLMLLLSIMEIGSLLAHISCQYAIFPVREGFAARFSLQINGI